MRRMILLALGLGILGAVGCHHVAGICDCAGVGGGGCGCCGGGGPAAAAGEAPSLYGGPIVAPAAHVEAVPAGVETIPTPPRPLPNDAELK